MRKEDKYRELVRLHEVSGLSVKEFCSNQDIARATFYYWRKKIKKEKEPNGFIPLLVKPGNTFTQGSILRKPGPQHLPCDQAGADRVTVELAYPNGVVVSLKNDVGLSDLKSLIHMGG